MDQELIKKIEEQQIKIDAIYKSVEKTRKYFQWTLIITIIVFVLPLVLMIFAIPAFINSYSNLMGSLTF